MTALIAVYTSDGCVGRCDAKCYNAESPNCDCICGGANHGCGKDIAARNTRLMAEEWAKQFSLEKQIEVDAQIDPICYQTNLFFD